MYTPRTSVEAIPNASIHHLALQKQQHQLAIGHMYDRLLKVPVIHSHTMYDYERLQKAPLSDLPRIVRQVCMMYRQW